MAGALLTYYTCTGLNPLLMLTLLVSVADQPILQYQGVAVFGISGADVVSYR